MSETYTLRELCARVDLPVRTVRYYIQEGLVDRPEGETRAARYGQRHLDQLLRIKQWTAAGLSLQRIRELLTEGRGAVPAWRRARGTLEVLSRLYIAEGVELLIDPARAGLGPEQVRAFTRAVMQAFDTTVAPPGEPDSMQASGKATSSCSSKDDTP